MADAGDLNALADALMELHYDPAYARSSRKDGRRIIGTVEVLKLDTAGVKAAAQSVAECVEARRRPVAGGQGPTL